MASRQRRTGEVERGAAALLVAGSLMFLIGAAVMAVDVSGFLNTARTERTTADLSCLAGVAELPDATAAIELAADYAADNWSEMDDASLTFSDGETATLADGDGNLVLLEANPGGSDGRLRITVSKPSDTFFAGIFGAHQVPVTERASCGRAAQPGMKMIPFGALPAWDGILQLSNPCETGNCRVVDIPRSDVTGSGNQFIRNTALGAEPTLEAFNGTVCTPETDLCGVINLNQGVSMGQLSDALVREGAGVEGLLRDLTVAGDDPSSWTFLTNGGRTIDAMTPEEVFGDSYAAWNGEDVDGHDPEIHGPLHDGMLYIDGPIAHCDSPRLVQVPILAQMGWMPGMDQEIVVPDGNSEQVQVIGFYNAVIVDPNGSDDFGTGGPDNVLNTSAVIWWPGPNAECEVDGEWLPWSDASIPAEDVKLVAG